MDVRSYKDGKVYEISFRKGEPAGDMTVTELPKKERRTGTIHRWRPDLEVFTDIAIPLDSILIF